MQAVLRLVMRTYQGSRKAERCYDLSIAHVQQILKIK